MKKPAKAKCQEQGGRLLRVTSLYDINMLTAAAGGDVNSDPYDGHAIAAEDILEEGTWKSYETLLDAELWSDGKPDGADVMNCAFIVVETGMEDTSERYRKGYAIIFKKNEKLMIIKLYPEYDLGMTLNKDLLIMIVQRRNLLFVRDQRQL